MFDDYRIWKVLGRGNLILKAKLKAFTFILMLRGFTIVLLEYFFT